MKLSQKWLEYTVKESVKFEEEFFSDPKNAGFSGVHGTGSGGKVKKQNPKELKDKFDMKYVQSIITDEGFAYAMSGHSAFEEVDDEEFHMLRNAYIDATEDLQNYINSKQEDK
jgi:sugar phosphate isomerase/epimerase